MPFDPSAFKPGLLQPIDMSKFVIKTAGRTIVPYDGEQVWMEPYLDADGELRLVEARDALTVRQEEAERLKKAGQPVPEELTVGMEQNLELICGTLAEYTLGWNLSDKFGAALPDPSGNKDAFMKLPTRAQMFLLNEALGVESKDEEVKDSDA